MTDRTVLDLKNQLLTSIEALNENTVKLLTSTIESTKQALAEVTKDRFKEVLSGKGLKEGYAFIDGEHNDNESIDTLTTLNQISTALSTLQSIKNLTNIAVETIRNTIHSTAEPVVLHVLNDVNSAIDFISSGSAFAYMDFVSTPFKLVLGNCSYPETPQCLQCRECSLRMKRNLKKEYEEAKAIEYADEDGTPRLSYLKRFLDLEVQEVEDRLNAFDSRFKQLQVQEAEDLSKLTFLQRERVKLNEPKVSIGNTDLPSQADSNTIRLAMPTDPTGKAYEQDVCKDF